MLLFCSMMPRARKKRALADQARNCSPGLAEPRVDFVQILESLGSDAHATKHQDGEVIKEKKQHAGRVLVPLSVFLKRLVFPCEPFLGDVPDAPVLRTSQSAVHSRFLSLLLADDRLRLVSCTPAYVSLLQRKNLQRIFQRGSSPIAHRKSVAVQFAPDAKASDKMNPWRKSGRPS